MDPHLDVDGRWRATEPPEGLTWGVILEGASFFHHAEKIADIRQCRRIVEVGPGYGRLLKAIDEIGFPLETYVGVELSKGRVESLRATFSVPNIAFVEGDARNVDLSRFAPFDLLISSATFEHISPDFLDALIHLRRYLAPCAKIVFDLIDTGLGLPSQGLCKSGVFIRVYSRREIRELVNRAGLRLLGLQRFEMQSIQTVNRSYGPQSFRYWLQHNRVFHVGGVRVRKGRLQVHRFLVVAELP